MNINMNHEKIMNSHYLSISYKTLIKNKRVHHILFLIEVFIIFLQIIEIYYNDFKSYKVEEVVIFNPLNLILKLMIQIPNYLILILYFLIIMFIIINNYILNVFILEINFYIKIIVNINELLFFRLLSLFMFNYLFLFTNIYLIINIIITFPYILLLIFYFYNNYLFLFFPSIINYPYDSFSMVIDLNLLAIKFFISISAASSNKNISKLSFIISLFILFLLLLYLSIIIKNKSYYLMNNCNLNKFRYGIILNSCIMTFLIIILDKKNIFNIYYKISYFNILILCLLLICYFYEPYKYSKFDNDNNIENVYYYFFILDRVKNNFLLLEEKIEEHLTKCNRCNLCKKYYTIKNNKQIDEYDLYYVIYNGKDLSLNLMNSIALGIKKNGKSIFFNNSHYLISLIYIYCFGIKERDYNYISNIELLYEIINSENKHFLEEYKISLNQIKNTNDFLIKSKNIIQSIYEILDDKNIILKELDLLKLSEEIDKLEIKEIKYNINNNHNIEGLPNCNNLLTICSLFYEELYNESISNSTIYIKDNSNLIEDLINHNNKNSDQITFKIDIQNFNVEIIRAGGQMNKYQNINFFDCFPSIFKKLQMIEMKNILLNSNDNFLFEKKEKKDIKNKRKKDNQNQNINFNFIIEEKENNILFNRLLKLKLNLILLSNINIIIYLNGKYTLNDNIIVTKQEYEEEIVLSFGNKEQINAIKKNKSKDNKNIIITKIKKNKFLGNNKLVEYLNCFIGYDKYNIYHFLPSSKKNLFEKKNEKRKTKVNIIDNNEEEKTNNDELLLIKEMGSQASSTTTSLSKNYLISYYKGIKKIKNDEDIMPKFNFAKYILLFSIICFFIFIIFQSIYIINYYNDESEKNNYYLLLK